MNLFKLKPSRRTTQNIIFITLMLAVGAQVYFDVASIFTFTTLTLVGLYLWGQDYDNDSLWFAASMGAIATYEALDMGVNLLETSKEVNLVMSSLGLVVYGVAIILSFSVATKWVFRNEGYSTFVNNLFTLGGLTKLTLLVVAGVAIWTYKLFLNL